MQTAVSNQSQHVQYCMTDCRAKPNSLQYVCTLQIGCPHNGWQSCCAHAEHKRASCKPTPWSDSCHQTAYVTTSKESGAEADLFVEQQFAYLSTGTSTVACDAMMIQHQSGMIIMGSGFLQLFVQLWLLANDVCNTSIKLMHGQLVGQNCRGRPRTVWNNVVLFDIHKLKLNRYTRDALNKPVWRELTFVARTWCLLAKYTF